MIKQILFAASLAAPMLLPPPASADRAIQDPEIPIVSSLANPNHAFGAEGFNRARCPSTCPRRSLNVGSLAADFPVSQVINPWNEAAGWTLFSYVGDVGHPQVTFVGDLDASYARAAYVKRIKYSDGSYRQCIIHFDPGRTGTTKFMNAGSMSHEIGHCLGFRDHLRWHEDWWDGSDTARQCSRPDRAEYSAYSGVMSYCSWDRRELWWDSHDRASLYHWGYGIIP